MYISCFDRINSTWGLDCESSVCGFELARLARLDTKTIEYQAHSVSCSKECTRGLRNKRSQRQSVQLNQLLCIFYLPHVTRSTSNASNGATYSSASTKPVLQQVRANQKAEKIVDDLVALSAQEAAGGPAVDRVDGGIEGSMTGAVDTFNVVTGRGKRNWRRSSTTHV